MTPAVRVRMVIGAVADKPRASRLRCVDKEVEVSEEDAELVGSYGLDASALLIESATLETMLSKLRTMRDAQAED